MTGPHPPSTKPAPLIVYSVMIFDGERWTSHDGKWWWDGRIWRRTTAKRARIVFRFKDVPIGVQICRGVLVIQGSGFGCAGLMLLMIGVLATLGGAFLTAFALFGTATVAFILTTGFVLLALKVCRLDDRWTMILLLLEVGLIVVGVPLFNAASYASDHAGSVSPGTDGPFADGGNGLATLASASFVGGGFTVLAVLLWARVGAVVRWLRFRYQSSSRDA